jgi:hypothetical protein
MLSPPAHEQTCTDKPDEKWVRVNALQYSENLSLWPVFRDHLRSVIVAIYTIHFNLYSITSIKLGQVWHRA